MSEVKTVKVSKKDYEPERILQLSAQWRVAIIHGGTHGKPLTNQDRTKLIAKQRYLDLIKEILSATGKILIETNNTYCDCLLEGYNLACDNVWQRFEEIDNDFAPTEYAAPKQLKLPAHKRTMVDSVPYYQADLENWLKDPQRHQQIEEYRNLIEQIPVLLKWKEYNQYLFFGRPDDMSLYEPFDDAIVSCVCVLHRDCANLISSRPN